MRRHQDGVRLFQNEGAATRTPARGRGAPRRLREDKRGAAAVFMAGVVASTLGIAGLTVEVGQWYLLRRNMQAAADAAAMAGALNYESNSSVTAAQDAARSVAYRNGFPPDTAGTAVTPAVDTGTGRVTVTVQRPQIPILLRAAGIGNSGRTVRAQAVAQVVDAGAPPCVHTLVASVSVGNNTDINAPNCALVSDSAATDAFKVGSGGSVANGAGHITAANIITHGGCEGCAEAVPSKLTLTRSPVPTAYAPTTSNPYAQLDSWTPTPNGCKNQPNGTALNADCYKSLSVPSGATITLKAGVYYIQGGNFDVQGTLRCGDCTGTAGVAIVLVGSGNSAPGIVDINAQATIDLHAGIQPTQPLLNGVLIYRQPGGRTPKQNGKGEMDINGGALIKLNGAIIGPDSWITMGGNASTAPDTCNVFIAHSMDFRGNTSLSAEGCNLYGTKATGSRIVRLMQ